MYLGGTGKEDNYRDFDIENNLFERFKTVLSKLKKETNLTTEEIQGMLSQEKDVLLPLNIFLNRRLGILEVVVKFLHEEHSLKFSEIARLLDRDSRTVWSTYSHAHKKYPGRIVAGESDFLVPLSAFGNRSQGVLESLVLYLRERYKLGFSEIGRLLGRDPRTIWTVHDRAMRKNGGGRK